MSQRFEMVANCPGPGNPAAYLVRDRETGRWLGGVGANFYRPWVFPLYTPSGLTVIQEFPYDHPFHNGVFVGQHPVRCGDRDGNFWAMPPRRSFDDAIWTRIGRMDVTAPPEQEALPDGYRFVFKAVWRDEQEQPLLDETRSVRFHVYEGAHAVDVTSAKTAAHGALEFPKTKYGSLGVRVEPRLLAAFGGVVIADGSRRGAAAQLSEKDSDFIAYENDAPGGRSRFGVCLRVLDAGARGPWFIRDYGMAMYNPTWTRTITVPAGESWTIGLRVVAYDGTLAPIRTEQWASG